MDVVPVVTAADRRRYRQFVASVYADDPAYRRVNEGLLEAFLGRRDAYARRCFVKPVLVGEGAAVAAAAVLVASDDSPTLRLSFLEFRPDADEALRRLVDHATRVARDRGLTSLLIGVNGQISYGFGILEHDGEATPEFDTTYNPPYYTRLLDRLGWTKGSAQSFEYSMDEWAAMRNEALLARLARRYTYRCLDLKHFRRDCLIFGGLCHRSLEGTPLYSPKTAEEMADSIRLLRWLLQPADLIFAYRGDEPVGTVFTHPDYAENLPSRRTGPIGLWLASRRHPSRTLISDFIGVVPEHRRAGPAMGLLQEMIRLKRARVDRVVGTFIIDDNRSALDLSAPRSTGPHRRYAYYQLEV